MAINCSLLILFTQLCDCSEKEVPLLSTGEKFRKAFIFLVKSTIVAGLIYWTHSEGVWSDNTKTEDLYYRMLSTVAPSLPRRPDVDDVNIYMILSILIFKLCVSIFELRKIFRKIIYLIVPYLYNM